TAASGKSLPQGGKNMPAMAAGHARSASAEPVNQATAGLQGNTGFTAALDSFTTLTGSDTSGSLATPAAGSDAAAAPGTAAMNPLAAGPATEALTDNGPELLPE